MYPARRGRAVPPIQAVLGTRGAAGAGWRRAIVGLVLLPGAIFGADFWFGGQNTGSTLVSIAGIAGTMAMFAGMAVAAPFLILPLIRALAVPLRKVAPSGGRLASDAVRSNPARTAAAAVALTIGLSVFVVNEGMSQSFLGAIEDEIDAGYARDFTVQPLGGSLETGGEQVVPAELRERIARMPETEVVTPVRSMLLDLPRIESGRSRASRSHTTRASMGAWTRPGLQARTAPTPCAASTGWRHRRQALCRAGRAVGWRPRDAERRRGRAGRA